MRKLALTRFFFFSSRRRHTRSKRDWSSDVCSSDLLRCDVLAAGGDDDVLLAIRDAQEAVFDRADVAGMEPPIGVDYLGRRFRFLVVALHHVRALRQDLAVVRDRKSVV